MREDLHWWSSDIHLYPFLISYIPYSNMRPRWLIVSLFHVQVSYKLTRRSTNDAFSCCCSDYLSADISGREQKAYKNIHRMSLLKSLGGHMNRILGWSISWYPELSVELGTDHFPSHFSHIRPIAIYQLEYMLRWQGTYQYQVVDDTLVNLTLSARDPTRRS